MKDNRNLRCSTAKENCLSDTVKVRAFIYENYSIELHYHDFYEVNIILSGKGIHQIENNSLEIESGDVFVIPPFVTHAYYNTEKLYVYHILIHKDFIKENTSENIAVPGYLQLMEIESFLRQNFSEGMFLHLSKKQLIELTNELKILNDDSIFKSEEYYPIKKHTTRKIICWLSFLLNKQLNSKPKKDKYEPAILQTLEYIHQNFAEKITVELLAKNCFLSRSTFLRSFYTICNCTPTEYLTEYRIKQALELMEGSNLSKTEIAHNCGFYDLSHMEKTIKKDNNKKSVY